MLEATSHIFAAHAQMENNIFTRDFNDIPDVDLFIPSHNIDDVNHGPFTEAQVLKQDAWPEWKAAASSEINQIAERDVFELVDETLSRNKDFSSFRADLYTLLVQKVYEQVDLSYMGIIKFSVT